MGIAMYAPCAALDVGEWLVYTFLMHLLIMMYMINSCDKTYVAK